MYVFQKNITNISREKTSIRTFLPLGKRSHSWLEYHHFQSGKYIFQRSPFPIARLVYRPCKSNETNHLYMGAQLSLHHQGGLFQLHPKLTPLFSRCFGWCFFPNIGSPLICCVWLKNANFSKNSPNRKGGQRWSPEKVRPFNSYTDTLLVGLSPFV